MPVTSQSQGTNISVYSVWGDDEILGEALINSDRYRPVGFDTLSVDHEL
jgi:hypothetical protein